MRRTHVLKTYPDNFNLMRSGLKPFDIRQDDRIFRDGDEVIFREWDPDHGDYTGRVLRKKISCKMVWGGLSPGYCAIGLIDFPSVEHHHV
jgi:hypothetical protein